MQVKEKIKKFIKRTIFLGLVFLFWWLIFKAHFWPTWLFPSPITVLRALIKGLVNGSFVWGALISLKRVFLGFGVSLILGTILGFSLAKLKKFEEVVNPFILGLQTLPSICWLPLALLWFGLNEKAIIFIIIMGTVLSMTIAVKSAVKNIPPAYIAVGRMLGARRFNLYRFVIIPAILPSYINGLRQSWSFAWRSLMSGEMLFITIGLGQLLMFGRELNDMALVMAVMMLIILIGTVFDQFIFGAIEKRLLLKWGLEKD